MTLSFPASVARSAAGSHCGQAFGRAGTAAILSTFMTVAARIGTLSKRGAAAQRAGISGCGPRASVALVGRSIRNGTRTEPDRPSDR